MYNLFVIADKKAWEYPSCEYDKDRIFEYTPEYFVKEFNSFSPGTIDKLKTVPSLFIHEMFEGKSKVGYIKEIKQNYGSYHLSLDFICEIPSKRLSHLQSELGFKTHEISRTHWAVKDIDLVSVLKNKKILTFDQPLFSYTHKPLPDMKFDIAFSFPGEKRELISEIVDILKRTDNYTIFYDKDFTEQLAMPEMDLILMDVYKKQSQLICILLSKEYQNKKWCQLEWKSVREIITDKKDSIMFLRCDNAFVSGVSPNDGYIDINEYSPEEIAVFIRNRLKAIKKTKERMYDFTEN
jgi:hypothetical protein